MSVPFAGKMPSFEHLLELRRRLLVSLGVLIVAFIGCLHYARTIFGILVRPLLVAGEGRLIYTDVFEAFFAEVRVALFAALMICFPVLAMQAWRFIAPGLYLSEKRVFLPFLLLTPIFFAGGACFAYFLAMPWALHFLLGFQGNVGGVRQDALPGVGNYLSFVTRFLFGFGVAFLLPLVLVLAERVGLVTREQLRAKRRYMIVAAFAVSAVLTPPDVISQLMLALPLCLLYEGALVAMWLTGKRKAASPKPVASGAAA